VSSVLGLLSQAASGIQERDPTELGEDHVQGAQVWCAYGVLAHNLAKLGGLHQTKQTKAA
jgi:hypothetical protein